MVGVRRWWAVMLAAIVFSMLATASASATTYHVSPSGSNTPPYDTYAKAAHQLQDANTLATEYGDTVYVHAGTYSVDSSMHVQRGVSWIGISRDSVTVVWANTEYGSTYLARFLGQNTVAGFEFQYPFGNSNIHAYAVYANTYPEDDSIVITHCRFYKFKPVFGGNTRAFVSKCEFFHGRADGIEAASGYVEVRDCLFSGQQSGYGVTVLFAGDVLIAGNVFDNTLTTTDTLRRQYAVIRVDEASHVTIQNNFMRWARSAFSWYYASGIIENNTLIDVGDPFAPTIYDDSYFFQRSNQTLIIRNNLFDKAARLRFGLECSTCDSTGWIVLRNNAYWPPTDSFFTVYPGDPAAEVKVFDSANFNAYPMFADDSLYHLQAGSPLIDAGDPSILDVDGTRSDIGWTGGPHGIIPAYPELRPLSPDSVSATGTDGIVSLCWTSRPEADLAGYNLYRGDESGFWTSGLTPYRVFTTGDTCAADTILTAGESVYYVVTAFDTTGLESAASPEVSYTVTEILDTSGTGDLLPRSASILRAYPNPFNDATVIEFAVPMSARELRIEIFNVLGRRVDRMELGRREAGVRSVIWDASVPSGVYFARLVSGGMSFGRTVKLVVLR